MKCCICKKEKETRPYGPGRAPICVDCVENDPERKAIARMYEQEGLGIALALLGDEPTPGCPCPRCMRIRAERKTQYRHVN